MAKTAVQVRMTNVAAQAATARVIDIRTRKPWKPREPASDWAFLFDVGLTFILVLLGAWLFLKMRGG
jgi:hypothetical protein